ncbi:MAG: TldD/PmbA family protein [Anaerolineaceae bacterium]|nr:TldD/PmbA family protein [Anaerolineaceae bacterium]
MDKLENLAGYIIVEAKAQGADYVHCVVRESEKREFNVDGGRFSLMRTLFDRDVAITVLKDQRKGSVHVNRFDEGAIYDAIAECIAASESAEPDPAWQFCDEPTEQTYVQGTPVCDTEKLFFRTKELLENIRERHPKILIEQMITSHDSYRSVYLNSNCIMYHPTSGAYSFSLMYSAHEGEKSTSFFGSDVTLANLDKPIIECALIDRELSEIEKQLDPVPLEGKFTGTVLLAPQALSEIVLGTVFGNFVSDSSLIDGTSIWKDKLGEKVADERLSITLRAEGEDVVIGQKVTGEGYPAENFDLIRDGKLVSFDLSQYGANKTGQKRAGCSAGNLFIPAGEQTLEEIIKGIEKGLLVMRFSGGEPAPSGEYSGVAKNSFLIENGKVTNALAETMISGCVPDMLNNIRAISRDVLKDGSNSIPYIAFNGITISGK